MSVNRPLPPKSFPGDANWGLDPFNNQELDAWKLVSDPGIHGHPVVQFVIADWVPLLQINGRSGMLRLAAIAGRNLQTFTATEFFVRIWIDGHFALDTIINFPSVSTQRDNGITIGGIIPTDERNATSSEIGGVSMGQIPWQNQMEILVRNNEYPNLEVAGFVSYHLTS